MPRDHSLDATVALMRDPYGYIGKRCEATASDVFEARILLRRTICMRGREAARVFYDPARFMRKGAAPLRVQKTLFGTGGVQGLDGAAHRMRKAVFMRMMTPSRVEELGRISRGMWQAFAVRWAAAGRIVLYDELQELLMRSICEWSGVPLDDAEAQRRTREVVALFDHAGDVGPTHWWSRFARKRAERWIGGCVDAVRDGRLAAAPGSALYEFAWHRDEAGAPLSTRIAAVEVLNVLRPTVAVSVFIVHAATALHRHPEWWTRLADGGNAVYEAFVQEVRRFYPFFPAAMARVRERFEWNGHVFPRGRRAMLDLYGTDHDPRIWKDPDDVPAGALPRLAAGRLRPDRARRRRLPDQSPLSG